MDNDIYLIGEVGWEVTLQSVIDMVAGTDTNKTLNVHIHSPGGDLYEGRAIYNYLKTLPQGVDTYAVGVVASAATVFMLAGKNKYAYSQNNVLIHLPMTGMHGNSEEMRERADSLEAEEIKIAKIYEAETNLSFDEAMALMKEDRMMTDEEVVKFGLTIKKYKAVAKLNIKNKDMSDKKEEQSVLDQIKALFAGQKKEEVKDAPKAVLVKSADGREVEFFERMEGEISVGDKVTVNGETVTEELVMATGQTYKIENGVLKSVEEKKEADVAALMQGINDLTALVSAKDEAVKERDKKIDALTVKMEEQSKIFSGLKAIVGDTTVDEKEVKQKSSDKKGEDAYVNPLMMGITNEQSN